MLESIITRIRYHGTIRSGRKVSNDAFKRRWIRTVCKNMVIQWERRQLRNQNIVQTNQVSIYDQLSFKYVLSV